MMDLALLLLTFALASAAIFYCSVRAVRAMCALIDDADEQSS